MVIFHHHHPSELFCFSALKLMGYTRKKQTNKKPVYSNFLSVSPSHDELCAPYEIRLLPVEHAPPAGLSREGCFSFYILHCTEPGGEAAHSPCCSLTSSFLLQKPCHFGSICHQVLRSVILTSCSHMPLSLAS